MNMSCALNSLCPKFNCEQSRVWIFYVLLYCYTKQQNCRKALWNIFSYFHPDLDRHTAECLLLQNGEVGTYLLRNSSEKNSYVVSVRWVFCVLITCIYKGLKNCTVHEILILKAYSEGQYFLKPAWTAIQWGTIWAFIIFCVCEQPPLWQNCIDVQACKLLADLIIYKISWTGSYK